MGRNEEVSGEVDEELGEAMLIQEITMRLIDASALCLGASACFMEEDWRGWRAEMTASIRQFRHCVRLTFLLPRGNPFGRGVREGIKELFPVNKEE